MSNAPFACPHCRGAMNLPAHLAGMTVACPHCKKPFQVPRVDALAEPALNPDDFSVPRPRRSLDSGPGMSRWLWIILGTACAGALIAVIVFLPSKGGLKADLNQARIKQLYDQIKQGTPGPDAIKYAREIMKQFPGDLKEDPPGEEEDQLLYVFEKGDHRIIFWVNTTTNQVVKKRQEGILEK